MLTAEPIGLVADELTRGVARPAVSCVIVAYHRPVQVERLAAALVDPRIEIIIVNVEDDLDVGHVDCDQMIPTAANVGYGAAVNRGVAASQADVVVFMNDDVAATASDVLRLAERILTDETDVAVPLVARADGRLELGNRAPLGLARRMLLRGMPVPSRSVPIDAAWAPVVAVRMDLIRTVPIPEDYFLYWEEFEWFYNLRERDSRIELNPGVSIGHAGGPDDVHPAKSRLLARNAVRCVRRTRGRGAAVRAWPVVVLWQLQLLLSSVVVGPGSDVRAHAAGVRAAFGSWRELGRDAVSRRHSWT
jgi:N-acetylglucosaminyl-diphospho-decaprenol L-rhamnosyltransferase